MSVKYLFIFALLWVLPLNAQFNMTFAAGGNVSIVSSNKFPLYTNIQIVPRLNYRLMNFTSVGLSAPIEIGSNIFAGRNSTDLLLDLPLLFEIGAGHKANNGEDATLGAFAGAGGCFTFLSGNYHYYGYQINAGLRFNGNNGSNELRFSYGGGLGNQSNLQKIGVSFLYFFE